MIRQLSTSLILILTISTITLSQEVTFDSIPLNLQLYPRDFEDSSEVIISGKVSSFGFDSLSVEIFKDGQIWKRHVIALNYTDSTASFLLNPKIYAELAEYSFKLYVDHTLIAQRDSIVCGDVFLINGQSNALAIDYDGLATNRNEWFRSFGNSSQIAADCAADLSWGLAQGNEHFSHAAVGVWGLRLGQLLVEKYQIPVCLINGATGGSYIKDHLRNNNKPTDLSTNYGRLLYRAKIANVINGVRAIFWYQGEMNTDRTYMDYANNFKLLRDAWKEDFPNLFKIYLFQIRPTQGEKYQSQLRETQRQLAEQYDDVEIMSTNGLPGHDGLHYHYIGYTTLADWIFPLVARDFYGFKDTLYITPPNIKNVFYSSDSHDKLVLEFDQPVIWSEDTLGASLKDYFYPGGGNTVSIDSGYIQNENLAILELSSSSTANVLTYLPSKYYNGTSTIYEGPWLKSLRGIGALSFCAFPITYIDVSTNDSPIDLPEKFRLYSNYPNPFNPSTIICYKLFQPAYLTITIHNITGQIIETICDENQLIGEYFIQWNSNNIPSGMYFYRFIFNNQLMVTHRMVLLK